MSQTRASQTEPANPPTTEPTPDTKQRLRELEGRLKELSGQLEQAHQTVAHLERREKIDALLRESEVVDLPVARLLTELAVQSLDEPELRGAIEELRRDKPYLFQRRGPNGQSAMSARLKEEPGSVGEQAAEQAARSGDRRDLLRYLRLRRHKP